MSKWGPSDDERDQRFVRARIVDRYVDGVSFLDYLAHCSRADPFEVDHD